ncbi:unnamed protein product [Caenorhabditis bovis]|uniref:UDP-glucuronosyltransferase n=1 Tax=Caenorhabditis bovis TaxID=2654633 RepID=A0A8S1EIZ5_9PELO|nr:unnamed protein product [Caenorhabditis bovis]
MHRLVVLLAIFLNVCYCAKILIYCPSISQSHVLFIPSYIPSLDTFDGAKQAKVWRLKNISNFFETLGETWQDWLENTNDVGFFGRMNMEYIWWIPMCKTMVDMLPRMKHITDYNFDLAIIKDVDYCDIAIVRSLGIRKYALLSSEPLMDKIVWDLGIHNPPSYVPSIEENALDDRMSFWQRLTNSYKRFQSIVLHYIVNKWIVEIFREKVDPNFPSTIDLMRNCSIVLVNTNEMFDLPRPISPKVVYIGSLGHGNGSVDSKIDEIFNKGALGSVYISFGTVAPFDYLPIRIKRSILTAVQGLPDYHFIIKIPTTDTTTAQLFQNVTNVDLLHWVPQNDVLKHPNLRLFVTHGGMNSVLEGATGGVPMLVMPVFTDQFRNGKNVERRGNGLMIRREDIEETTFLSKMKLLLDKEQYVKVAKRIAKMITTRPFIGEERVTKWINFTIRYDLHEIYDLTANTMFNIQYFLVDIILFFCIFILGTHILIKIIAQGYN